MIYFVTTRKHRYTMGVCLQTEGKALVPHVKMMNYGQLFLARRLPVGVYIFADIERLSPVDCQRAAAVWQRLEDDGRCRLFNHPGRVLKRYPLLRELYDRGINNFNVYRLTDREHADRFPVFIRGENDHRGPRTELLRSRAELRHAIAVIDRSWKARTGKIITEFCDVADQHGVYRKYSCFLIDGKVMPRHLFFRHNWLVKGWELLDPHLMQEEQEFFQSNPHAQQVRQAFAFGNIDFGRIDYGILDGKVQVWEINTNPLLLCSHQTGGPARQAIHDVFNKQFVEAFIDLDHSVPQRGTVRIGRPAIPWWKAGVIPAEKLARKLSRGSRRCAQQESTIEQLHAARGNAFQL